MTAYKIDHLGVAVASIDDALSVYRALGLVEVKREDVATQKVTAAFLPVGESRIELLEPTSEDSPVAKFLEKRGEGLHHICVEVDDIEASLKALKAQGAPLIDETPKIGAGGAKIAFVHPKGLRGVLTELRQGK